MGLSLAAVLSPLRARLDRDAIAGGLLDARVTHVRHAPRTYALSHRLSYLSVPLAELGRLDRRFMRHNRPGLFSLRDRDYGEIGEALDAWIRRALCEAGAPVPDGGTILLLSMPRVAGFAFNPVSFWMCQDAQGRLISVLAEVNNTFGERHCYLCRKPGGGPIAKGEEIEAEKVFHVSPFLPVDGVYRFRFHISDASLSVHIALFREGQRVLTATIAGKRAPLTSWAMLGRFLRHPFPTLQVVGLIHYHAARLYLRGLKVFSKPAAPARFITPSRIPSTTPAAPEPS